MFHCIVLTSFLGGAFFDTLSHIEKMSWVEKNWKINYRGEVYSTLENTFLSTIKNTDCRLLDVTETALIKTLLFRYCSIDAHTNTKILNANIEYILTNERFDVSLFHS